MQQARRQQRRPALGGRFLAAAAGCLASCSMLEAPTELAPPPDLTFHHVAIEQFKGGFLSALSSATALQYTRDTGHLEGQHVTVSPVGGSLAGGVLRSNVAVGSTKSGVATLSDGVHWQATTGEEMDTNSSLVDLVAQTASGHEPILIHGAGYKLSAPSFDSRYGPGAELQLHGGVQAVLSDDAPAAGSP